MSEAGTGIIVRRLTEKDRSKHDELVWELDHAHHTADPTRIRHPNDACVPESEYLRRLADPECFMAGAENETGLIGFIRASMIDGTGGRAHHPARYTRIEEIVVRSDQRRGGAGRALLMAVRDWAKAKGAQSLELGVYAFNAEALAFYALEGFNTLSFNLSQPLS
jgi:GNAT superfamily N-acetyltransferase